MLRDEHQLILDVIRALARMLAAERKGDPLDYDTVASCITFFRLFADACHHGKEEDLLFPALEAEGMPHEDGPIAVMLHEHEMGRTLVRRMAAALPEARNGEEVPGRQLRDAAEEYVGLLEAHIDKEDNVLFNLADGMVRGPECRELCSHYNEVCGRRFDGKTVADLERLAAEIRGAESDWGRP
jgi:hemerythrin-like domain-containing protein